MATTRQELKRRLEEYQEICDNDVAQIKPLREADFESIERQLLSEEPNLLFRYMKCMVKRDGCLDTYQLPHTMENIKEKIKEKEAKLKHECSLKWVHQEINICRLVCHWRLLQSGISSMHDAIIANPGPPREIRRYDAIMHMFDDSDIHVFLPDFDVAAANQVLVDVMENP